MSVLYIVATPIGNLKDITLRALEVLKEVDFILCEDTRKTKKLLAHYDIHKPLIAFHQHSPKKVFENVLKLLEQGKNLALVSEAGTPGISDPGNKLVEFLVKSYGSARSVGKIAPVPGPSALTAALSVSGVGADKFVFLGFPPAKKGRKKYFEKLKELNREFTAALYESPHRFLKTLDNLIEVFGEDKNIVITRELTKLHEEIFRGSLKQAKEHFKNGVKGELVLVLGPVARERGVDLKI